MSDDSTAQADPFADYGIRSAFTLLYEAAAELTMAFQVIHRKGGRPAAEGQKQSLARLTVLLKEIRRGDRGEDAKRLAELVRSWDTRPSGTPARVRERDRPTGSS